MIDMRDAARAYIEAGYQIVPLPPGTKAIHDAGWQDRTYTIEDVRPDSNLGLKCIPTVVDIDCPLALQCADAFLPITARIDGRSGKPRSHRAYAVELRAEDFTDIDSAFSDQRMLVQILAGRGKQAVVPPSLWVNNGHQERRAWVDGSLIGPPASTVDGPFLRSRVVCIAAVALIARHWPKVGVRRELRLAYARVLLETLGLDAGIATDILEWACRLGGSDENGIKHAARAVRATKEALDKRESAIGANHIRRTLPDGAAILNRLREWFHKTDAAEKAVEELNDQHALIWQQSGSLVVLTEDTEDGQPHLRFSKPSDMSLIYPETIPVGSKKNGDPILKPRGTVWLTHPQRRFYRGIEVAPAGRGNAGYYNMWRGFSVEPKKGEWPLFHQHLELVGSENPEYVRYIWAWMAETVQRPDRPIGIALAFKGKPGTGKSTFAKWFGSLFGVHFLHLDSEQHLLGRFNAHLHNTIVLLADEAVWAGSKAGLGALKRMITEDTLNIERKNVDVLTVKNMIHMIVASNEKWVVPAGFDNRRFAIFGTSTKYEKDGSFFEAVHEELFRRGGLAALLYELLEFKGGVLLQQIPETEDLREQKELSADVEESWWLEKLHQGHLVCETAAGLSEHGQTVTLKAWPEAGSVAKDAVHDDYLQFLDRHHRGSRARRSTETELGRFLKKRTPLSDQRTMIHGERLRVWDVPSLAECRAAWITACGWPKEFKWGE